MLAAIVKHRFYTHMYTYTCKPIILNRGENHKKMSDRWSGYPNWPPGVPGGASWIISCVCGSWIHFLVYLWMGIKLLGFICPAQTGVCMHTAVVVWIITPSPSLSEYTWYLHTHRFPRCCCLSQTLSVYSTVQIK